MEEIKDIVMEDDFAFDPADFPENDEADGNHTDGERISAEQQDQEKETDITEPTAPEEGTGAGEEKDGDDPAEAPKAEPETYELKVLGETRTVTMEEMKALAQMGADRDRIIRQRDDLAQFQNVYGDHIAELESIAKSMNMDIPAVLASLQTSLLVQNGMSREAAEQKVRADRAELKIKAGAEQQTRQEQVRQRQERDIQEFIRKHPNVDPRTIHPSVWDAVRSGETLVSAYGRYEMQQVQAENVRLKEQIAGLQQNNNNKEKSLGSMKSAGRSPVEDDFMKGFDEAWT